ncbi:hypothetical protein DPMN_191196 [Dreissena polymorpha]|uniref:Uncharacterized protein n=1 Tax=Dreissena polymorpha TaxID=45954 RepID=A0A9D3XZM7_DREPO|nr:hypothetical protein DPMN_191196 [Dreissena polymorpha]
MLPEFSHVPFQAAYSEVTALTVPSNVIAVWAHVTVLRVHVEMVAVKTDGQEYRVMKVSSQSL